MVDEAKTDALVSGGAEAPTLAIGSVNVPSPQKSPSTSAGPPKIRTLTSLRLAFGGKHHRDDARHGPGSSERRSVDVDPLTLTGSGGTPRRPLVVRRAKCCAGARPYRSSMVAAGGGTFKPAAVAGSLPNREKRRGPPARSRSCAREARTRHTPHPSRASGEHEQKARLAGAGGHLAPYPAQPALTTHTAPGRTTRGRHHPPSSGCSAKPHDTASNEERVSPRALLSR